MVTGGRFWEGVAAPQSQMKSAYRQPHSAYLQPQSGKNKVFLGVVLFRKWYFDWKVIKVLSKPNHFFVARRKSLRGDLRHFSRCKTQKLFISLSMMDYFMDEGKVFSTTTPQLVRCPRGSVWVKERFKLFPAIYLLLEVPFRKCASNNPSPHFSGLVIPSLKSNAINGKSNKAQFKRFIKGKFFTR